MNCLATLRRAALRVCGPAKGKGVPMRVFWKSAGSLLHSEDGPTATEYAVMLALIIVVAIAALAPFGDTVHGVYVSIAAALGS